jgi:PAS domain-containing protein
MEKGSPMIHNQTSIIEAREDLDEVMSTRRLESSGGDDAAGTAEVLTEGRRQEALLTAGALQSAIFNSANFSIIATDAKGAIQLFNVGAERMLGYTAAAGFFRYLTKPIKVNEFMDTLNTALEFADKRSG